MCLKVGFAQSALWQLSLQPGKSWSGLAGGTRANNKLAVAAVMTTIPSCLSMPWLLCHDPAFFPI
jgi:hypothetical protein